MISDTCDIPSVLNNRMFPHQKDGVDWMVKLFESTTGGILGDDMGLGYL